MLGSVQPTVISWTNGDSTRTWTNHKEQTSVKFVSHYRTCLSRESIWICRQDNFGHFVQYRKDDGGIARQIVSNLTFLILIHLPVISFRTVSCAVDTAYHTPDLATRCTILIDVQRPTKTGQMFPQTCYVNIHINIPIQNQLRGISEVWSWKIQSYLWPIPIQRFLITRAMIQYKDVILPRFSCTYKNMFIKTVGN